MHFEWPKIVSEYDQKIPQSKPQTNPLHREEEYGHLL